MKSKMYNLIPGMMLEENQGKPALPLYSRVYSFGYAMESNTYAVISEPDEHNSQKLVSIGTPNTYRKSIDKYARPISKKFGIGVYWDDLEPDFRYTEEEVREAIKKEDAAIDAYNKEKKEKAEQDAIERGNLPNVYPFLTPLKDGGNKKKNLVNHLKHEFPGIRFSVRKENYSTYNVRWTDGPTDEQVSKITNMYKGYEFDQTGDYYDPAPTNFTKTFGGFKFVFTNREISPEIESLLPELEKFVPGRPDYEVSRLFRQILAQTPIPKGAKDFKLIETDVQAGQEKDFYSIAYTEPEKVAHTAPQTPTAGKIEVVDYSPKAIAVIGDTKPVKDTLKGLGGRFNPRLKCGAGWIFPKSKEDEVKTVLEC